MSKALATSFESDLMLKLCMDSLMCLANMLFVCTGGLGMVRFGGRHVNTRLTCHIRLTSVKPSSPTVEQP